MQAVFVLSLGNARVTAGINGGDCRPLASAPVDQRRALWLVKNL
jgi:hypothetical protein